MGRKINRKNRQELPENIRKYPEAGISHDPEDAPHYSHRTLELYNPMLKQKVLCIEDEDKSHYPFLKQWNGMEIDIENQFSINNGTLGFDLAIHMDGKHRFEYLVRLKNETAQKIVDDEGVLGISNHNKKILLLVVLPKLNELPEFIKFKKQTDQYVKDNHLSPKAWSIQ